MGAFVFGQVGGDKTCGRILGDKLAKQGGHATPLALGCRGWRGVDERVFASSPCVGVLVLVLRIQSAEQMGIARISKVDMREVPGGKAHADPVEVTIARRKLKADAFDAEGAIALALCA
jgi:hypothetical protein